MLPHQIKRYATLLSAMLCWIVCPFLGIILFFGSDLLGIFFCTNNCCAFLKEFARKITTNYMEVLTSSNKPMSIVIYVLRYASSYIRTSGLKNGVAHIKTFKHTNRFWSFWQIGSVVLITSLNCTFLDLNTLCSTV